MMATVTKIINLIGTSGSSSSNSTNGNGVLGKRRNLVGDGGDTISAIGLHIEVSSGIVGDSCKLFVLIPPGLSTVKAFKNHLATNILKTHVPFYFFKGEFRIPDEEDISIFAVLTEPCRIVPVPLQKSALSITAGSANGSIITSTSTPLPLTNGNGILSPPSAKRVKFSDKFDLDVSGIETEQNVDMTDGRLSLPNNQEDERTQQQSQITDPSSDSAGNGNGSKRRRRQRKHKSKKRCLVLADPADDVMVDSADDEMTSGGSKETCKPSGREICGPGPLKLKAKSTKNTFQEYDADESEIDLSQQKKHTIVNAECPTSDKDEQKSTVTEPMVGDSQIKQKKKKSLDISEFLSPNTVFSETGYKRLRTSTSGGSQKSQRAVVNGSGNSHSSVEMDVNGDCDGIASSGKRRDTPMLPKILKNPCATYELVKKTLSFNAEGESETESSDERNVSKSLDKDISEGKYSPVLSADEVKAGDKITFQVLELDENYSPSVSAMKMAKIVCMDENGVLQLSYIGNEAAQKKERSGIYEIDDEELESEALDNRKEINFKDLIKPCIIQN